MGLIRRLGPGLGLLILASGEARAIVNGTVDPDDSAVVYMGPNCTGVVIAPHIVLTASECVNQYVRFGPNKDAITAIGDTHYPESDSASGLGLLQLRETAPVTPLRVNRGGLEAHVGEEARLVGFGRTGALATDEGVRRQGPSTVTEIVGNEIRLDADAGSPCEGDRGGPILMPIDGVELVVGVMSKWPSGCGVAPSIGMRADLPIGWIDTYIERYEPSDPPVVSILSPMDGASVSPIFEVTVDAADDRRVHRVELWVDGQLHDSETEPPFTLTSLPTVEHGPHAVEARAFDLGEQEGRAAITVVIGIACEVDADCVESGWCDRGACRLADGASCERHTDCASGFCGATDGYRFCTWPCQPGGEACPSGFTCEATGFDGAEGQCVEGGLDGCAASGRRQGVPWALLAVFAALARWSARSRSRA